MTGLFSFQTKSANVDKELDSLFSKTGGESAEKELSLTVEPLPDKVEDVEPAQDDNSEEKIDRTLFVGNVPVEVMTNRQELIKFKKFFKGLGQLESIRFRSVAISASISKKKLNLGRVIKNLHPNRHTCNAYVVFKDKGDVEKTLARHGGMQLLWSVGSGDSKFESHLQLDVASPLAKAASKNQSDSSKHNCKSSVFVGNLGFQLENEALYKFFEQCGEITNVRIIRDPKTLLGKGFGYVAFRDKASVNLACKLAGQELDGRPVRVQKAQDLAKKKEAETEGMHAAERRIRLKNTLKTKKTSKHTKKLTIAQQTRKMVKKIKSAENGMGKAKSVKKR